MTTSAASSDESPQQQKHKEQVSTISKQIAQFNASDTPFRIFHGNTNSTRPSVRTKTGSVDISSLNNVLSVNTSTRRCLVEPNVPMDALVAATLPHGLVPPVVPEFPGITVGGAVAGTAGESSSFRHGFFDKSIAWAEVILADGEVVVASKDQNEDLFFRVEIETLDLERGNMTPGYLSRRRICRSFPINNSQGRYLVEFNSEVEESPLSIKHTREQERRWCSRA